MGRRKRRRLPEFTGPAPNAAHKHPQKSQGRKPLQPLPPGKVVRLIEKNFWATIEGESAGLNGLEIVPVHQGSGQDTLRGDRQHLLPTSLVFTPEGEDIEVVGRACLALATRPSFGNQATLMDPASAAQGQQLGHRHQCQRRCQHLHPQSELPCRQRTLEEGHYDVFVAQRISARTIKLSAKS